MTKLKLMLMAALIAIGQIFALPALAAEEGDPTGFYVGGGAAFANLDCPFAGAVRCTSDTDTVPYINIGYMLDKNFGGELGYLHEAEFGLFDSRDNSTGTFKYSSLHFAGIGRFSISDNFAFFGKLGVAHGVATREGLRLASVEARETGLMFGGGLEASFGDFGGRLSYSRVDQDLGYGELSILYRFR